MIRGSCREWESIGCGSGLSDRLRGSPDRGRTRARAAAEGASLVEMPWQRHHGQSCLRMRRILSYFPCYRWEMLIMEESIVRSCFFAYELCPHSTRHWLLVVVGLCRARLRREWLCCRMGFVAGRPQLSHGRSHHSVHIIYPQHGCLM